MGLHIKSLNGFGTKIVTLTAVFALLFQPISGFVAGQVASAEGGSYSYSESNSLFSGATRYVQANGAHAAHNTSAEAHVPSLSDQVRFFVNGDESLPIDGISSGSVNSSTTRWRLQTPLAVGQHQVTAEYRVNGVWHPVTGGGTVYSVTSPVLDVQLPNDDKFIFRGGDRAIVRVKVSDAYSSFKRAEFVIDGTKYEVFRDQADLRQAGNYVIVDVTKASNWAPLPDGNYTGTVQAWNEPNARASTSPLSFREFVIDNTAPLVTDFETPALAGKTLNVSAKATDANGVDRVKFYVAQTDVNGVCKNNLPALIEKTGVAADNSTYTAAIDVTGLNGSYCVLVSAADVAQNNSTPLSKPVTIDTAAPSVSNISIDQRVEGNIGRTVTVSFDINDQSDIDFAYTRVLFADGPNTANQARESAKYVPIHNGGNSYKVQINTLDFVKQNHVGNYNLAFTLRDVLGNNTSTKPLEFRPILIDNSGPGSTLSTPISGSTVSEMTRFTFLTTDDTGVGSGYVKFNGPTTKQYNLVEGALNEWYVDVNTRDLLNGSYTLDARFVDKFGTPRYGSNKGSVSVANLYPDVVGENFNSHKADDYIGISVGFRTRDLGQITGLNVIMERADGSKVTRTAGTAVLGMIEGTQLGQYTQLTTPFIIQEGSFVEADDKDGDGELYWLPGTDDIAWDETTRPVSVKVVALYANSDPVEYPLIREFSDSEPAHPSYSELLASIKVQGIQTGTESTPDGGSGTDTDGGQSTPAPGKSNSNTPQGSGLQNAFANNSVPLGNPVFASFFASDAINQSPSGEDGESTEDVEVLGDDDLNLTEGSNVSYGSGQEADEGCAEFFGLCWYWWVAIGVGAVGTMWLLAALRQEDDR